MIEGKLEIPDPGRPLGTEEAGCNAIDFITDPDRSGERHTFIWKRKGAPPPSSPPSPPPSSSLPSNCSASSFNGDWSFTMGGGGTRRLTLSDCSSDGCTISMRGTDF